MIVKTFKYAIHSSKRLFLASRLSRAQSRDLNLHILRMIGIRFVKMQLYLKIPVIINVKFRHYQWSNG